MIDHADRPDGSGSDAIWAILDFYVAAGVDGVLDDEPHDWFAAVEASPERAPIASPHAEPPQLRPITTPAGSAEPSPARHLQRAAAIPPDEAAADARRRAAGATTLAELEALVADFDGCALKASARQLVFADGTPGARVMLVGEAPGADEDRAGRPFVGRAGQLLDRMLAAIGLGRQDVYLANIVPWRPPGNRKPTPQEIAICRPFVERQVALAAPDMLVTLGPLSSQSLLDLKDTMFQMRGRWKRFEVSGRSIVALPMLHPEHLLRQPAHKAHAWRDLKTLKRALDGKGPEVVALAGDSG